MWIDLAKKTIATARPCDLPRVLDEHIFYGLRLDDEQKAFGNMILDEKKKIIFCSASAGTGKTTIAVGTAVLMVNHGVYDNIVYTMHSVGDAQGFLPGTISEKSEVWFEGLYQALVTANQAPHQVVMSNSLADMKSSTGFVKAITDTYLRGSTIGAGTKTIFIIDEAQNFDEHSLRKTLTRANDDTKVIVIGHAGQIDLPNKASSGFVRCMNHFMSKEDDRFGFCELKHNHRGLVSRTADEDW